MNFLIYVNHEGELRAFGSSIPSEFDELHNSLQLNQIIYLNGSSYPHNIPESMKDTAPLFIKSILRQWQGSVTLLAPKPAKAVVEAPVAAPKPKKPRKKKVAKP